VTTTADAGLLRGLRARLRAVFSELAKFGTVGAMAFVVDVGLFNLVLHVRPDKPLTAKVISTVVAATFAYILNRAWSFRHRQRSSVRREYALFFLLNAVGLGIALGCLGFSHYVLGLDSRLADNISGNVFGIGLGTLFRFWSYRRFVWAAPVAVEIAALDGDPVAVAVLGDVEDGTISAPAHSA
jgi:putative flippase GtrA